MDWILMIVAGFGLLLITAPIAMLLLTFFVLVPLAHLMPAPTTLARATFDCPISRKTVNATFVTAPGREEPADVLECSVFGHRTVTCQKKCCAMTSVAWAPSPMVPRFALIADDVAIR